MSLSNINAQDWLDRELYPFESHFYDTPNGKMHYIDEGKGEVVLFVHGTPAWSFLYRDQIKVLAKNNRCIAVDHLGFGLSDKPKDFSYHPKKISQHLNAFIDSLNLKDITLVVHDFGGPIGLPYAIENPNNVKRLVLFNTWLWSTADNKDVQKIDKIVNSFLGKWLYLRFNFSAGYLLKNSFEDKSKLSKEAKNHYKKVFPSKEERYGPYKIAQMLKGASEYYSEMWERIDAIKAIPKLFIWGMKDDFIKPAYLKKWTNQFPEAKTDKLPCGHFSQEEETQRVNEALTEFISDQK